MEEKQKQKGKAKVSRVPYPEQARRSNQNIFQEEFRRGERPSREMCRQFLRVHPIPCTEKIIHNKVRNMIKNKE